MKTGFSNGPHTKGGECNSPGGVLKWTVMVTLTVIGDSSADIIPLVPQKSFHHYFIYQVFPLHLNHQSTSLTTETCKKLNVYHVNSLQAIAEILSITTDNISFLVLNCRLSAAQASAPTALYRSHTGESESHQNKETGPGNVPMIFPCSAR